MEGIPDRNQKGGSLQSKSQMRRYLVLLLSSVMVLTGCFSRKEFHTDGVFSSVVEMSDTTAVYGLWVTVRTSARCCEDSIGMMARIISPDGRRYSLDTLVIPVGKRVTYSGRDKRLFRCMSVLSNDVKALYRTGVCPVVPGDWKITFTADPSLVEGVWVCAEKK